MGLLPSIGSVPAATCPAGGDRLPLASRIADPRNLPRKWALRAGLLDRPRLQQDVVAEVVEAAEEVTDVALPRLLVQDRLPELAERHAPRQHVVGRDQDLVGDRVGG